MRRMDIEEYKQTVTQILVKIDKVCRENDLKYALGYGTLLGAIRHKGFIPWDDDADIIMMREDYNKLIEIIERDKDTLGINFLSIDNHPDMIYPFGKICDTSTVLYEKGFRHVEGLGAFVDVFPWDYIPEDPQTQNKLRKKYYNWVRLIEHSAKLKLPKGKPSFRLFARQIAYICAKAFDTKKLIERFQKELTSYNKTKTGYVGLFWEKPYPAYLMDEVCDVEYEGHMLCAPARYDEFLTIKYGDYMTPPPVEQQVNKHYLECYKISE